MIDSHAHLDDQSFAADRPAVLARARLAGLTAVVNPGADLAASAAAVRLAATFPRLYPAVGVSPPAAGEWSDRAAAELSRLLDAEPRPVAVGEIGLDYHYGAATAARDRTAFAAQLELAARADRPVIIHNREATDDIFSLLADHPVPRGGVFHCFSQDAATARRVLERGFHLSLAGNLAFRRSRLGAELAAIGWRPLLGRLLVETDSPYLAPPPHRGRRNEPARLPLVLEALAALTGRPAPLLARATAWNAIRLFDLPCPFPPVLVYPAKSGLYLNLTNRCPNRCSFCPRVGGDLTLGDYHLGLRAEPAAAELAAAVAAWPGPYRELVCCGFGEPTLRLETLKETARALAGAGRPLRLNTNGQGSLINGRDIVPELAGLFAAVSVSLNAPDRETYNRLCRPDDPERAFPAVLDFVARAARAFPAVTVTAVALPGLELEPIAGLARSLGADFRRRRLVD